LPDAQLYAYLYLYVTALLDDVPHHVRVISNLGTLPPLGLAPKGNLICFLMCRMNVSHLGVGLYSKQTPTKRHNLTKNSPLTDIFLAFNL
jgi:hypothetical protein